MEIRLALRLLAATCLLGAAMAGEEDDRDKRVKKLNELSSMLNRHATDPVQTPEREFLHERIAELIDRARKLPREDHYVFGRLTDAADDFLDASEEIEEAAGGEAGEDDIQERAARNLEETYFDLQQGEYFARQSGDPHADEYVRICRRLYQTARAAYEREQYAESRDLAEAAREVVGGLEGLAQAAVRIPTPPTL